MEAATAATAVALIAAAFSCAGLVAQAHAPALQAVAAADTEDSVAAAAEADHSVPASPATPSAAAALPLAPPQKQPTLFDMFATPPSSLSPLVEQLRTVTAQQATDCVIWFSGQCHLTGKKRLAAYNQAQKKASDLLRTVPMKRLVELHGFFISQRDRGEVPSVPPQFAGYWSSSRVAPQSEVAAPWQRTPTLVELLAVWLVGPSPSFPTVCAAVHHFLQCKVNDARMCAKEIIAQHPRHRIAIFCALAQVQRALKREKVPPAGFQQVFKLQQHVKAPKRKEECHGVQMAGGTKSTRSARPRSARLAPKGQRFWRKGEGMSWVNAAISVTSVQVPAPQHRLLAPFLAAAVAIAATVVSNVVNTITRKQVNTSSNCELSGGAHLCVFASCVPCVTRHSSLGGGGGGWGGGTAIKIPGWRVGYRSHVCTSVLCGSTCCPWRSSCSENELCPHHMLRTSVQYPMARRHARCRACGGML